MKSLSRFSSLFLIFSIISLSLIAATNSIDKYFLAVKGWQSYVLDVVSSRSYEYIAKKRYRNGEKEIVVSLLKGGAFVTSLQRSIDANPNAHIGGFPATLLTRSNNKGRVIISLGICNKHAAIVTADYINASKKESLNLLKKIDLKNLKKFLTNN